MGSRVQFTIHLSIVFLYSVISSQFACFSFTVASENESAASESKGAKETIDFNEHKRVDHILASLQRKLPPVPLPHLFRMAIHHLQQQKPLKTSKRRDSCVQLIPLSIKVRLRE